MRGGVVAARNDAGPGAAAGQAWTCSGLVFTTRYGNPVEPRNFNRYVTARCAAASVRQITVHDAQRTCAALLVDLDIHPRIVMRILRHAQFDVTMDVDASASSEATREALSGWERASITETCCCASQLYGPIWAPTQNRSPRAWDS